MPRVVIDSTVLVSAFLTQAGVSRELLREAQAGHFEIVLAEEILTEAQRVLLEYARIRKRYKYTDEAVIEYVDLLRVVSRIARRLPDVRAVDRDSNDNPIVACAVKAEAHYIVTRDRDLLSLRSYEDIKIISPEAFMGLLRSGDL